MASLTGCLKAAGDLLPADLKAAVLERASALRGEGVPTAEASRLAVSEHHQHASTSLGESESALREGRTLYDQVPKAEPTVTAGAESPETPQFPADLTISHPDTGEPIKANDYIAEAQVQAEHVKATAKNFMSAAADCLLRIA